VALSPVYYLRTDRLVALADFTTHALIDIGASVRPLNDGAVVQIVDDPGQKVNVSSAFGDGLPHAVALRYGKRLTFRVDSGNASTNVPPAPCCPDLRLALVNGHLVKR
jgi:hypothetical protein